jgi:ubiquinone/menaquinone biosynthesis C-methylase UbiE
MATKDKRRYFNELAPRWDALPAPEGVPAKVCAYVRRAAAAGARRVLDVGCGTGILLPRLLEACPQAVITELDLAEDMLKANAAKLAVPRVRHVCADGACLPFAEAAFDLVLCFGVLPHFEDLAGALGEMGRVLQPGGALAVGHLMGSAELNAFHSSLDAPVAGDVLPTSTALAEILAGLGLGVTAADEAPDWYFVRGEKPR